MILPLNCGGFLSRLAKILIALTVVCGTTRTALAEAAYAIRAGDQLYVSVWNEEDLQLEVLVRPDGYFSLPLVGEVEAAGRSVAQVTEVVEKGLARFIPEPEVTVMVTEVVGTKFYVIGQVTRPGAFIMNHPVDVMQALSLAGGTTPFAALGKIKVLRRQGDDPQAIPFDYGEVAKGENLDQNLLLQSGDVIVVP